MNLEIGTIQALLVLLVLIIDVEHADLASLPIVLIVCKDKSQEKSIDKIENYKI